MQTNYAKLTEEQKTTWSLDFWKNARNLSFINKFLGKGPNSLIHHVTELKQSEKGARAVVTLLADLQGDGIAGDRTLEGNEEELKSFDQVIQIDQMRNANRNKGRMADQKTVVNFREHSRDALAYWLANKMDEMAFLTLSGVPYTMANNGIARVGSELKYLEFAADVSAPTANRRLRWDGTNKALIASAATTDVATADKPTWNMFVQAKAYAKTRRIRPCIEAGGQEAFHAFLTPQAMALLKQDADYMANLRHAQQRDGTNPLFTGSTVKLDGIYLHEDLRVYNTSGATSGNKWGSLGAVDGCQILFCGAQSLAMADISQPTWEEKGFDYENSQAIAIGKILGFLKPKFGNIYEKNQVEDFGVVSIYTAQ